MKASNKDVIYSEKNDDSENAWARSTKISEAKQTREKEDERTMRRTEVREQRKDADSNAFVRGANVNKVEERKERAPREEMGGGMMSRNMMGGTRKAEEEAKEAKPADKKPEGGKPMFTNSKKQGGQKP